MIIPKLIPSNPPIFKNQLKKGMGVKRRNILKGVQCTHCYCLSTVLCFGSTVIPIDIIAIYSFLYMYILYLYCI